MAIREDNKKVQDNMNYQTDKFKMQGRDKEEPVRILPYSEIITFVPSCTNTISTT